MRQLTHSETCMVNAYFNFLSLIQGQRPMEYQLMELEQFARAKKAGCNLLRVANQVISWPQTCMRLQTLSLHLKNCQNQCLSY